MEIYDRKAIFKQTAEDGSFIEVCEWTNGDGFDVEVQGTLPSRVHISYMDWDVLKLLVEELENRE